MIEKLTYGHSYIDSDSNNNIPQKCVIWKSNLSHVNSPTMQPNVKKILEFFFCSVFDVPSEESGDAKS